MTESEFDTTFGAVWASKIIRYRLNMLKKEISFVLETNDDEVIQTHHLVLKDVSMFYFIGEPREYDEDAWLEFTEINILCANDIEKAREKYSFVPCANLEIGLWDSFLLVNAKTIVLDGTQYQL